MLARVGQLLARNRAERHVGRRQAPPPVRRPSVDPWRRRFVHLELPLRQPQVNIEGTMKRHLRALFVALPAVVLLAPPKDASAFLPAAYSGITCVPVFDSDNSNITYSWRG